MKILFLTISVLIYSSVCHSGVFRWVDESGKVHYSDTVPPKIAQNGHTKLHANGMVDEVIESAEVRQRKIKLQKIKDERAAFEKAEQAKKDLQEMRDTQLLAMFGNTEELIKIYDSKLEMTDGSVAILNTRHKKLSETLAGVEARYERMTNPNAKNLLGVKIDGILDDLHIYQQAITENLIEKAKIEKQYKLDLERFKYLTEVKAKKKIK